MRCPYCPSTESKVIDSRMSQTGDAIRRRRECEQCERRYTTYEKIEQVFPLVVKQDGRRQPFDRNKIMAGVGRACVKRPISADELEQFVDSIERTIVEAVTPEVQTQEIGKLVLKELKKLDQVAYVRFASVYRDFRSAEEFTEELRKLRDSASQPLASLSSTSISKT